MIFLVLNVLFNALMLTVPFIIPNLYMHQFTYSVMYNCIFSYVIVASLTLIGYTRLSTSFIGLFSPGRKLIGREEKQLAPLFESVLERMNNKYGTTYKREDFRLRVSDSKVLNAFALGYNTITINRGCFTRFSDGQLQALLAHELAHIYYKDSVRLIALIYGSFGTRMVMWIFAIVCFIQRICSGITYMSMFSRSGRGVGAFSAFLGYGLLILFLPVYILNWVGSKVFYLFSKKISRITEYRADEFAASLGYKAELISVLEIFDESENNDNSFQSKLMATHPATMLRVGALEDGVTQKDKLGSVLSMVPGAEKIVGKTDSTSVFQLGLVLVIIGLLYSGLNIFAYAYNSGNSFNHQFKDISILNHKLDSNLVAKPKVSIDDTKHEDVKVEPKEYQVTKTNKVVSSEVEQTQVTHVTKKVPSTEHHVSLAQHKKARNTPTKVDDTLHITNVYKISDNQYSIQYDYKGQHGVLIKKESPRDGITMNELNSMQ